MNQYTNQNGPARETDRNIPAPGLSENGEVFSGNTQKKKVRQKKILSRGFISAAVSLSILLSGAAGFTGTYLANKIANDTAHTVPVSEIKIVSSTSDSAENAVISKAAAAGEKIGVNAITAVAIKAGNAVVSIATEVTVKDSFYGQYVKGGAGSGVIITENGYIITCAHVISGASNITVTMADGTKYPAKLVGSDTITDIAVIKVDQTGLPFAEIGNSEKLLVGEDTVAIGNPLGELGGTVTNGIISALDREVQIGGQTYNLLQTNAAINPGNSGGGLFNLNGELIGVVNAKTAGSGIEGLGFAIPINDAIKITEQLIDFGYIKGRPKLGVNALDVSKTTDLRTLRSSDRSDILNYITDYGVYFLSYNTEYQTEGDLEFGDRIVAIDGVAISDLASLTGLLNDEYAVGDTVKITVARITDLKTKRSLMVEVPLKLIESIPENVRQ